MDQIERFLQKGRNRRKRKPPTISVVIPTFNEAENLPLVLPYLDLDLVDEVLLVDGLSSDATIEVAKKLLPSIKIILEERPGKGAALRAGYEAASGDIIIVMDADGSHDPREIPRLIQALVQGADFVKGSRFAPLGGTTDMPRIRKLGNWIFVKLVNLLFSGTFTDLCYGYHAFWRYCLEMINLDDIDGFEIDTAIYLRALRKRLRIIEFPSFEGYRFHGSGKLRAIPDGWRVLRTIFREWYRSMSSPPHAPKQGFHGEVPGYRYASFSNQYETGINPSSSWLDTSITQQIKHSVESSMPVPSAEERARTNLQLLYTLSVLIAEKYLNNLMPYILKLTLESVRAASGSVLVIDENGEVKDGCLVFFDEVLPLPGERIGDIARQGLAGWILANRQPALVTNTREDSRWLRQSWEEREEISRSALAVPLMANDRVFGVLTLVRPEEEKFTQDDLSLLSQFFVSGGKPVEHRY